MSIKALDTACTGCPKKNFSAVTSHHNFYTSEAISLKQLSPDRGETNFDFDIDNYILPNRDINVRNRS